MASALLGIQLIGHDWKQKGPVLGNLKRLPSDGEAALERRLAPGWGLSSLGRLAGKYRLVPLIVVVGLATFVPIFMVIWGSFRGGPPGYDKGWSLDGYVRAWSDWSTIKYLITTFALGIPRIVLGVSLAIALAWIVARTNTPLRGVLKQVIWLNYFLPAMPMLSAWTFLLGGNRGWINSRLMDWFGLSNPPLDIMSYWGIIFYSVIGLGSLLFLFIIPAFENMESSAEEASWVCGANRFNTLRRVTIPSLTPAILGPSLLAFMLVFASFEPELALGYRKGIYVFTTFIWSRVGVGLPDYPAGFAMASVFMVCVILLILLQLKLWSGKTFTTLTGRGVSLRPLNLGRWKWATFGFVMAVFGVGTLLPLYVLMWPTFQRRGSFDLLWGLQRYIGVFDNPTVALAFRNTMELAIAVATIGTVLFFLMSYASMRTSLPGRRALEILSWVPVAAPGIVLSLGYLWSIYSVPGAKLLYGTVALMVLPTLIEAIPLGMRAMNGGMAQLGAELEEAARTSGSSWLGTMRRVVIPLLAPTLLSAWLLVFLWGTRTSLVIIFLYVPSSRTVSLLMSQGGGGFMLGAVMAVVTIVIAIAAQALVSKLRRAMGTY